MGATTGVVNMVLATAINNKAVKVLAVMICLSSKTFAKMIMISALVYKSQPIKDASPACHFKILPAM